MSRNTILVPTNFSPQAEEAFKQSAFFSGKTSSDIHLMHVIPNLKAASCDGAIEIIQNKLDKVIIESRSKLSGTIQTRIECGRPIPQILKVYKEIKPDFVFMGSAPQSKTTPSTALKILDSVNCPLIIITGSRVKPGCEKIVLPLDLTKETRQKVEQTIMMAKAYGSEVHIVSVTNFTDEIVCNKIKNQINQVKAIFEKLEIKCHTKLIKTKNDIETMANAINDYADDINAGLIVIMTRQEKKLQKMIVGSMAIKLIRKSTVPIMCISPKN